MMDRVPVNLLLTPAEVSCLDQWASELVLTRQEVIHRFLSSAGRPVAAGRPSLLSEDRLRHPIFGDPSRAWQLPDVGGRVMATLVRFDRFSSGRKYRYYRVPWGWGLGDFPHDRLPLLRIDRAARMDPEAPVFVVEGPEACEAIERLDLQAFATTCGPEHSPHPELLLPLSRFRRLLLWPTNDHAGRESMAALRGQLTTFNTGQQVSEIEPNLLGVDSTESAEHWISAKECLCDQHAIRRLIFDYVNSL